MINDRHSDIEPYVFSTPEAAIEFARNTAHELGSGEVEEREVRGWLYYATYRGDENSVWVIKKTLDAEVET